MEKHTYLLILAIYLLSAANAFAQSKFGNATKEELRMTSYSEDTTAAAVVLNKDGYLKFIFTERHGFQFEYTEQAKIKILKTEGLSYADHQIPYYVLNRNSMEDIKGLSGTTYNMENGKVVKTKLSKDNIFEEDSGERWKLRKFTMPGAKVGSVIEYKYTIVSDFPYELRDFYFQGGIPIDYVNFNAIIPEYFVYNLNQQGYISLDKHDKTPVNEQFYITYKDENGRMQSVNHRCTADKYTFIASKVPAAKSEAHLWSLNDYISKVSFELRSTQFPGGRYKAYSSTWNGIDKDFMGSKSFGDNLKRANWFKDEVAKDEITLEKATAIEKMIKKRIQWNDESRMYSSDLKKSLNEGLGSSADMNFLLINALKAGGFEAFPVILRRRSSGRIPIGHPSITAFNYVITGIEINSELYYTDASAKFGTWNLLPEKCIVERARILADTKQDWVDLRNISSGTVFKHGVLTLKDNQKILNITETRGGSDAYNARNVFSKFENQEKFVESVEEKNDCIIEDFVLTGYDENGGPLKMLCVEKTDINLGDKFIYLSPPLSKIYKENPFKSEKRVFPIDFDYQQNYIQMIDINIPEGYEVAELPQAERIIFNDNDIIYSYAILHQENTLKVQTRYQLRNLLILPTEYEGLKSFFGKMISKQNEQIVFKKIETSVADVIEDEVPAI